MQIRNDDMSNNSASLQLVVSSSDFLISVDEIDCIVDKKSPPVVNNVKLTSVTSW